RFTRSYYPSALHHPWSPALVHLFLRSINYTVFYVEPVLEQMRIAELHQNGISIIVALQESER
ncbi:unnamed protein product, partial [Amoebophrya sp. A120]